MTEETYKCCFEVLADTGKGLKWNLFKDNFINLANLDVHEIDLLNILKPDCQNLSEDFKNICKKKEASEVFAMRLSLIPIVADSMMDQYMSVGRQQEFDEEGRLVGDTYSLYQTARLLYSIHTLVTNYLGGSVFESDVRLLFYKSKK